MIEVPRGKFVGEPKLDRGDKDKLSAFLFDPRNKSLKEAFEKAAGVELSNTHGKVLFFADKRESVAPVETALEELSKEVRLTVGKSSFQSILNKLTS